MSVQFILGRSGSGKTTFCIKAIVEELLKKDDSPLLFLVPEQATYQASAAILNDPRIAGYNRLHVLSFDRLVYLVSGKHTARPAVSRLAKSMIIQRVLRDCASKLTIFRDSAERPGLGKRLADTINQLQQYANTPDTIKDLANKLRKNPSDGIASAKFNDIAIIFEEYLKFIEGKFIDPEIQTISACGAVAKTDFLKGARLWVDGFAGFTTAELALLTELLKVVEDAQIALCLDPASIDISNPDKDLIDPTDLFGLTSLTYCDLFERIKKCKLKITKPLPLNDSGRFLKNPPLAHIERAIFQQNSGQISSQGKIRVVCAPNARAEARFVAQQITKLVRTAGYRYRDIAVIASDIDSYEHFIKASFEDYAVPFFIDKRKPLNQHPVIELIGSAFAAIINDFPANEIFAFLKTDLLDIQRSEVDLLENYCIAFGINGSDWQNAMPWQFAGKMSEKFNEPQVDKIRKKAISPLIELKKQLAASTDAGNLISSENFTKIVFDFLEKIGVRSRLDQWVHQSIEQSDYAKADEHRQLYDRLVDVFDEMTEAFAGTPLKCEDYLSILNSAFSQMTLAFIPPNLDQVLVGSIERSRHPDLKAVFLIGTTERQFPAPVSFDGILSEQDRLAAQSSGLDLPPGVRNELANRPYLAYIAFTRASDLLYITSPAVDQKSNSIVHSPFIDVLCLLFNDLKEELISASPQTLDEITSLPDLEDFLCQNPAPALLNEMLADDRLSAIASRVSRAIGYENKAQLDPSIINQIYGQHLTASTSRLSTFASCPYKHFARYILNLEKRQEFKFEPLDVGEFFHSVLDKFLKRAIAENINFETIGHDVLIKIVDEEVESICKNDTFISKFINRGPHNAFYIESAKENLCDCVCAIAQMISAGSFRPAMSEITFGKGKTPASSIGEFKITLNDGRTCSLNGRIDRVDIAQIHGRKVALIFDYKTSVTSFKWPEFFNCIDIQLPVYMLALQKTSPKLADDIAGAFYLPIKANPDNIDISEYSGSNLKSAKKARGIFDGRYFNSLEKDVNRFSRFYNFQIKEKLPYGNYNKTGSLNSEDFEMFLNFCSLKIIDLASQIFSGKISSSPYRLRTDSACSRGNYKCEFKPLCRFDWQLNKYNTLEIIDKERTLKEMKTK